MATFNVRSRAFWLVPFLLECSNLVSPIPPSTWRLAAISSAPALSLQELGTVTISFGVEDYRTASGRIQVQTLCNRFGAFYIHGADNQLTVRLLPSQGVGCDSADTFVSERLPHVQHYDLLPGKLMLETTEGDSLSFTSS